MRLPKAVGCHPKKPKTIRSSNFQGIISNWFYLPICEKQHRGFARYVLTHTKNDISGKHRTYHVFERCYQDCLEDYVTG